MRIFVFIIVTFSVNFNLLHAQQFSINGNVKDQKTGTYLAYANIRVSGTTFGTSANKIGEYEIKLKEGNYKLIASYIGYISDTIRINLSKNLKNIIFPK